MRVYSLGFRVRGHEFRVRGQGFRFRGQGFRVRGQGFRVHAICQRCRHGLVKDLYLRVERARVSGF